MTNKTIAFRLFAFSLIHAVLLCVSVQSLNADEAPKALNEPTDVAFTSRLDGTEQHYVLQQPKSFDANVPHDLLIALHGHGSDRWQFARDARDECRASRDAASQHNMIYVSPDYRAKTSWMGPAAESDLLQIIDDLNEQYRIDRIFICGGSMGGTSALIFTALHPESIDGVVSMNGTANMVEYTMFQDAITASYGGTKTDKADEYRKRSAELVPERFTMPVAFTTGGKDTLVPPESVLRLASNLQKQNAPAKLIHRPEGGHSTNYDDALAAFEFVLKQSNERRPAPKPILSFDGSPKTIVCLGDSVTGVYYHTGGRRAYPEMLELAIKHVSPTSQVIVINAGISGNTTQNGLERLDKDVLAHHPDLVTISFGLNDMSRLPENEFRENLRTLVTRCRDAKSQVVLCTPNSVINTTSRPITKLTVYCDIIREVGAELAVPVCDQYKTGAQLHARAPRTWRLLFSDEIHPNMDGHKRMAEELCRVISGKSVSLESIDPPVPALRHVRSLIEQQKPIKVMAMPPYDLWIAEAIHQQAPNATVEVTSWPIEGKSIGTLEHDAKALVRPMKPDLVILAVPHAAAADTEEELIHSFSWIMNWSLSFGQQEWDCIVIHPSVTDINVSSPHDHLFRRLMRAQHLDTIDRSQGDSANAQSILTTWFKKHLAP